MQVNLTVHTFILLKYIFNSVLSISFEVDVPSGKVGSSLLFERQRHELPRGVWGYAPPENFQNLDAWECYFHRFPDSIWALRTIKIKYVYYNRFFLKISITLE